MHLELTLGTPQISGAVLAGPGERQTFSGWLELVPLLENLRGAPAEPLRGAPPEPQPGGGD